MSVAHHARARHRTGHAAPPGVVVRLACRGRPEEIGRAQHRRRRAGPRHRAGAAGAPGPTGWSSTRRRTSRRSGPAAFFPEVAVTFTADGDGPHYHVPLLLSPFGYSPPTAGANAMAIVLGPNQYGKAETRVVRIYRDTERHEIRDLNVSTALRGDFDARAHPRRPGQRAAHRQPEEHLLRLRQGEGGGRDRGLRAGPGPPLRRRHRAGQPGPGSRSRSTAGSGSASPARPHPHTFARAGRRGPHHGCDRDQPATRRYPE